MKVAAVGGVLTILLASSASAQTYNVGGFTIHVPSGCKSSSCVTVNSDEYGVHHRGTAVKSGKAKADAKADTKKTDSANANTAGSPTAAPAQPVATTPTAQPAATTVAPATSAPVAAPTTTAAAPAPAATPAAPAAVAPATAAAPSAAVPTPPIPPLPTQAPAAGTQTN